MRKIILVMLAGILCACSSPTPTSSTPSTTSVSPGSDAAQVAGVEYLKSTERKKLYLDVWPAAEKVTQALLNKQFGEIKLRNENGKPLVSGYSGWGTIKSRVGSNYAYVWWNADMTVNFEKGVQGFSLDSLRIDYMGTGKNSYKVSYPEGDSMIIIDAGYFGGTSSSNPRYPVTIEEVKEFDQTALSLLQSLLASHGLN